MKYIVFNSAGEMPAILDDSIFTIPEGAIELDTELYESLLTGSEDGSMIVLVDGKIGLKPPPAIDQTAALIATFEQAAQSKLNSAAIAAGYDSIITAVSYADEPAVPKFQADGQAFRAWRSKVWEYAYGQLAVVQGGTGVLPTVDAFLAAMPALELAE